MVEMSFLKKVLSHATDKIKGKDKEHNGASTSAAESITKPVDESGQHHANSTSEASKAPAQTATPAAMPFQSVVDAKPANGMVEGDLSKGSASYKFEDFEINRTLGTGSFGRVQLVIHRPTQQYFAMKKLRKSDVVRLKQVEHTNNERNLLSRVYNPFIVTLVCTFQDDRHLYIVLEYVCGGELFSLLRKVRILPAFVAQFYAAEVVLALQHLHDRNIIYRDLKPENILLDKQGHIRLTDFGFAKVVPELTWTLCGTPDYLAPEIVLSRGYSRAVDWYALGVLIYEMLVGAPPFYNENQMKLYENIVHQPIRYPHGFDPVARDLLERLLEKEPTRRLGALSGGTEDIKRHPWFRDVKWDMVEGLRIKPPYKPKVAHDGDTSNFDHYPDEIPETGPIDDLLQYYRLFPDF